MGEALGSSKNVKTNNDGSIGVRGKKDEELAFPKNNINLAASFPKKITTEIVKKKEDGSTQ